MEIQVASIAHRQLLVLWAERLSVEGGVGNHPGFHGNGNCLGEKTAIFLPIKPTPDVSFCIQSQNT